MRKISKKKAAIELSMSTIVVLVLAMSMLILGLVLVRTIFKTATASVTSLDEKLRAEITKMFVEESSKVIVNLGADFTARVPAGTTDFGVAIGAKTINGGPVTKDLKYKLTLDDTATDNCYKTLGRNGIKNLFEQTLDTYSSFDKWEADTAYAFILFDIPDGTALCKQKVYVDVKDGDQSVGRTMFILQITRKGFF